MNLLQILLILFVCVAGMAAIWKFVPAGWIRTVLLSLIGFGLVVWILNILGFITWLQGKSI